jgi:hypothetical protein
MSSAPISRSADLRRLVDQGFELEIRAGHLVVTGIPYVVALDTVARGTLVKELTLAGDVTAKPNNHVVMWTGSHPCDQAGVPLTGIGHGTGHRPVADGLTIDRTFSSKPPGGYTDYHHLVTSYVNMFEGPAQAIDPSATARTFKVPQPADDDSPFLYIDTASSRAGITALMEPFKRMRIGIAGCGGTGSYILDLVAKTSVREIHLFDGDVFGQHNAFRAPGAAAIEELGGGKVEHWAEVYSRMRRGVVPHPGFLDVSNVGQLDGLDFVFVSMDPGPGKRAVVEHLRSLGTPFIDVGMGISEVEGKLGGILRVSFSTTEHPADIPVADDADGDYDNNVQIAELNAMTAAIAVLRWKKFVGFYRDYRGEHDSTYTLDTNRLNDDLDAA